MPSSQSSHNTRSIILLLITPLIYGMATVAIVWKSGTMSAHHDSASHNSADKPSTEGGFVKSMDASVSTTPGVSFSLCSFGAAALVSSICLTVVLSKSSKDASLAKFDVKESSIRVQRYSAEIANAAQQTFVSIEEIARSSQIAANALQDALRHAEHSSDVVKSLGDHTDSVTGLVREITSISEQTNLLALNATIEAARAGESGRGFSVVANEVKQLANDTRLTSQRVIDRVRCIQTSSSETISTTGDVLTLMKQCADSQAAISSAVEEQRTIAAQLARQAAELANEAALEPASENFSGLRDEYTPGYANRPLVQTDGKNPARRRLLRPVSSFSTT